MRTDTLFIICEKSYLCRDYIKRNKLDVKKCFRVTRIEDMRGYEKITFVIYPNFDGYFDWAALKQLVKANGFHEIEYTYSSEEKENE